jgi:hypothetical protein
LPSLPSFTSVKILFFVTFCLFCAFCAFSRLFLLPFPGSLRPFAEIPSSFRDQSGGADKAGDTDG